MALIKLGPTIAMAAGSIGGTTYARNRYGAYIRNRTKPVDPGSTNQNAYRTRVSNAVAAWQALTAAQRAAFNNKAKTTGLVNRIGESFHPSGINLFIRTYNLLDMAGLSQVTVPPATPLAPDPKSDFGYQAGSGFRYTCDHSLIDSGAYALVWHTHDLTNSTYFYKGPYPDFIALLDTSLAGDAYDIVPDASMAADTSAFGMVRIVQTDGAASHARRGRGYKPPA